MTIRSQDVSLREKNKQELKNRQKKTMDLNLIERTNKHYQSVQAATNDKKMINLLEKVRQSDTGVDEDFARFNGSHLYTQSIGKKQDKRNALLKENIDQSERDFPTQLNGRKPRKRILKEKVLKESNKPKKKEVTWNYICEQLDKPRWSPSTTTLFGGLRKTSPTYERELFPVNNEGDI